jgi:Uncharacterised protein family (UPF0158)
MKDSAVHSGHLHLPPLAMPAIRIDIDEIAVAMSDHDSEWVLDTKTGKVLMREWLRDPELRRLEGLEVESLKDDGEELDDELAPDLDALDDDRFVWIESIDSHEGFRWMERFALRQDDERVRERLLDALDRPRPFRRFKDALHEFPQVRDAWYKFEEEKLREAVRDWVEAREIDAELFVAGPPSSP